jgi:ATP-dependent exoDNAse (exonuclease V) alpha subunit
VRLLLYENKPYGLRHLFLEEAAEFVPQRIGPDQGYVYAEIEKLARMGGNASLGYTLVNQRAEEVNNEVLKKGGFRKADAFQQLQSSPVVQDAAKGQVLWVDEAGFLSVKQTLWLLNFANKNGCRVILSGDTKQHHGVERGDALRVMHAAGAIARIALSKIFRQ